MLPRRRGAASSRRIIFLAVILTLVAHILYYVQSTGIFTETHHVETENNAPNPDFTYTPNGLTVGFSDASIDSDGTIESRSWSFGDGGSSTSISPTHVYASAGTYKVTLSVTDDRGATGVRQLDLILPMYSYKVTLKVKGVENDAGTSMVLRIDVGDDGTWNQNYSYIDLSEGVTKLLPSGVALRYEFLSPVAACDAGKRYGLASTAETYSGQHACHVFLPLVLPRVTLESAVNRITPNVIYGVL
jgi:hypothetical protein